MTKSIVAKPDSYADDLKRINAFNVAKSWTHYVDSNGYAHERVNLKEWFGRLLKLLRLHKLPIIDRLIFQNFEYFSRNLTTASAVLKQSIKNICLNGKDAEANLKSCLKTAYVFNKIVKQTNLENDAAHQYDASVQIDVRKIVEEITIERAGSPVHVPSPAAISPDPAAGKTGFTIIPNAEKPAKKAGKRGSVSDDDSDQVPAQPLFPVKSSTEDVYPKADPTRIDDPQWLKELGAGAVGMHITAYQQQDGTLTKARRSTRLATKDARSYKELPAPVVKKLARKKSVEKPAAASTKASSQKPSSPVKAG